MPELPEVELTRRHLAAALEGRRFKDVTVRHPRTARYNHGDVTIAPARMLGRTVDKVTRRGKFLVAPLEGGMTMVAHLGMSGRFRVSDGAPPEEPHTHFFATMDDGSSVAFIDPRTFGFVAVFDDEEMASAGVMRLGPDAWDHPPTASALATALERRRAPIKALLLDQGPIAGLGNIYADESLFLAGIHPLTPGGDLDEERLESLLAAIRVVLGAAIDHGGTSLDDLAYLLPDGRAGENLESLQVYGRDGLACFRCGASIERVVVRSRSTHFCPRCQHG